MMEVEVAMPRKQKTAPAKLNPAMMTDPLMALPRHLPKGVRIVYVEPKGPFTTGKNPYREGTAEWKAFERRREENAWPWRYRLSSVKALDRLIRGEDEE